MSTSPESDFDLEKLFLPAWAKESPQVNRYAKFEGVPERRDDRRDRRDRPARGPGGPGGPRGPRPPGQGGGGGGVGGGGGGYARGRSPRAGGFGNRPGGGGGGRDRDRDRERPGAQRPPAPEPLPEIQVALNPEEHAVDLLTKQIRMTGRAFPLFDIAQLILAKPDRHIVTFSTKKKPDGTVAQALFLCALDESLWLSEDDAVRHVLDRHFNTFYQAERIKIDPPKGVYTFVAQCGMSGTVLGPPNYHDYQNQLRKLHQERFPRMPFDAFKSRVKIVKDEETVKKWVEEQSWKTEYLCLNLVETTKLPTRSEVEKHFRQTHLPNIIKPVETYRLAGAASRNLRDRELLRLVRYRWEEQKRFPIQVATVLSQQFATRGLQFFKVNKTVTHVAVARPHFLDLESTPVSDGVRRIVEFINAKPKSTPRILMEALAPRPATAAAPVATPEPPAAPVTEAGPADSSEAGEAGAAPAQALSGPAAPAPTAAPAPPALLEPTPEMAVVLTDLHWLIHQGHVIEFANGVLETAKKPLPRPPKPVAQPAPANVAAAETPATPAPAEITEPEASGNAEVAADPVPAAEGSSLAEPEAGVASSSEGEPTPSA